MLWIKVFENIYIIMNYIANHNTHHSYIATANKVHKKLKEINGSS